MRVLALSCALCFVSSFAAFSDESALLQTRGGQAPAGMPAIPGMPAMPPLPPGFKLEEAMTLLPLIGDVLAAGKKEMPRMEKLVDALVQEVERVSKDMDEEETSKGDYKACGKQASSAFAGFSAAWANIEGGVTAALEDSMGPILDKASLTAHFIPKDVIHTMVIPAVTGAIKNASIAKLAKISTDATEWNEESLQKLNDEAEGLRKEHVVGSKKVAETVSQGGGIIGMIKTIPILPPETPAMVEKAQALMLSCVKKLDVAVNQFVGSLHSSSKRVGVDVQTTEAEKEPKKEKTEEKSED